MKKRIAGKRINGKWTLEPCSSCLKIPAFVKIGGVFCKKCGKGRPDVGSVKSPIPEPFVELFPV
jgi:hypothetical protein